MGKKKNGRMGINVNFNYFFSISRGRGRMGMKKKRKRVLGFGVLEFGGRVLNIFKD